MNDALQKFARQYLKEGLDKLPASNQRIFKLMYARNDGKRSVEEAEAVPIHQVVDEMPPNKLDWAMQQVDNSFKKTG